MSWLLKTYILVTFKTYPLPTTGESGNEAFQSRGSAVKNQVSLELNEYHSRSKLTKNALEDSKQEELIRRLRKRGATVDGKTDAIENVSAKLICIV